MSNLMDEWEQEDRIRRIAREEIAAHEKAAVAGIHDRQRKAAGAPPVQAD